MILSSLASGEVRTAIMQDDVRRLQNVKGIGLKTAQRLVVELKDRVIKTTDAVAATGETSLMKLRDEALSALIMLGFGKPAAEKVLTGLLREQPQMMLENLIKEALKRL
jgi:Holliday junction DNA helicase RuvA